MQGYYHVWFSTKGRKEALQGELGDYAERLMKDIAQRSDIRLMETQAAIDHVHLLIELTATQTLAYVMHQLKGASARSIFLAYPDLKVDLGHNSFWQKGYGWRKVTAAEAPAVRRYIRTQNTRPLRHEH